jgi:hypothetical protein
LGAEVKDHVVARFPAEDIAGVELAELAKLSISDEHVWPSLTELDSDTASHGASAVAPVGEGWVVAIEDVSVAFYDGHREADLPG